MVRLLSGRPAAGHRRAPAAGRPLGDDDRAIAQKLHEIVAATAPALMPRTWYGMPAYAHDGKVIAFFKAAAKFDARYAEVGFNEDASLDDGPMWPTAFAVTALTPEVETTLAALVTRAAG